MNRDDTVWEEIGQEQTPDTSLYYYTGKWVALVRGRIVGSGRSIGEALKGVQHYAPEDEPTLVWVPESQGRLKN